MLPRGLPELIDSDTAHRLLASGELARLDNVAADDTPRVLPMGFHRTGREIVFATVAGARPDAAITTDTAEAPPQVLLLRGRAEVTDGEGTVPEYALVQRQSYGDDGAEAVLAEIDRPGLRTARFAVRSARVGGRSPEESASRGQAS